jgi:Chaperone of endosialidase
MNKIFIILVPCILLFIPCTFSQNVGIGTTAPSEKLHVAGNIKTDTLKSNTIKLTPNAAVGKVLTSDATGNASWQTAGAGSVNAFNGLIKTNDSVKLGGLLMENTAIRLNAKSLSVTDTGTAVTQIVSQPAFPLFVSLNATPVTQTFTAAGNGTLARAEIYVAAFGGSSITLQVRDAGGATLGSATNNYAAIFNDFSIFTFSNIVLTNGQIYSVSITGTGTTQVYYAGGNPYTGGSSSVAPDADITIRLFMAMEKNLFFLKENKAGIGTAAPAFKLDVSGSINTDSVYRIGGSRVLSVNLQNTFVGIGAATSNTTGNFNTATGFESLYSNTIGERNTAVGLWALRSNISGSYNTAIGKSALHLNSTGSFNTANGYEALYYNTTGGINTAVGYLALSKNTTGERNTAFGSSALYSNTTASFNTAFGTLALANNVAPENTAVGYYALAFNTTGQGNTAMGNEALTLNTTGQDNTAIGNGGLYLNTTGNSNTSFGRSALNNNTTGSSNTAIGDYSDVTSSNFFNATAIGHLALVDGNYKVRIGSTLVVSIGGQVSWSTFSDGRYKQNLLEDVPGISFINKLRPVTYTVDIKSLDEDYYKLKPGIAAVANTSYRHTGFIAQEVEQSATELGFSFSGVDKPQEPGKLYGLRYAEFVVPLVKAVQELSKQNEDFKKQNEELLKRIEKLESLFNSKIK